MSTTVTDTKTSCPRPRRVRAALGLLAGTEHALRAHLGAWVGALCALALIECVILLPAVSGEWLRSGSDMELILGQLRHMSGKQILGCLVGPRIGDPVYIYYRPVTSLTWYVEYHLFGEQSLPWQAVSLFLHLGSSVLLALLGRRIFRSPIAGVIAGAAWGFHARAGDTIEWTPGQTDVSAAFFALLGLLALKARLDGGRKLLLPVAAIAAVLSMGSKEVGLIVPGLGAVLALHAQGPPRRQKLAVVGGAFLLANLFFAWRTYALHGFGYLPGQGVGGQASAGFSAGEKLHFLLLFLLPEPLSGHAGVSPWASLLVGATIAATALALRFGRLLHGFMAAGAGLALASIPLDWGMRWLVWETYPGLLAGLTALSIVALALWRRPRDCWLVLGWGCIIWLPTYHIVYNMAGNVTYFPDTYWGVAWAWAAAAAARGRALRWRAWGGEVVGWCGGGVVEC